MKTVKVRNTVIGEGMPKICVPIVGVTKEAILEEARAITKLPADVVEWRIDWFENVFDFAALEDVMKGLREVLGDLPILMTFRTSKEGGEKALEDDVYADINIKASTVLQIIGNVCFRCFKSVTIPALFQRDVQRKPEYRFRQANPLVQPLANTFDRRFFLFRKYGTRPHQLTHLCSCVQRCVFAERSFCTPLAYSISG